MFILYVLSVPPLRPFLRLYPSLVPTHLHPICLTGYSQLFCTTSDSAVELSSSPLLPYTVPFCPSLPLIPRIPILPCPNGT